MTTTNPAADKARQQLMAKIDKAMKAIDVAMKAFNDDKDAAESAMETKALQAQIGAAARDKSPAAMKALPSLLKAAEKLAKTIAQRTSDMFGKRRRLQLKGKVNGALTALLLDLGKIQDPVLMKMMFAEQSKLRSRMDKAEKVGNDLEAVDAMDDIDDEMPALQERMRSALAVSAWLGTGFKSMLALAESSITSVPSERCRKVLRAEIDFVQAAKNAALVKLEVKAIENATVASLRRLQRVAMRLAADGSALDREMMRVGKTIREAGAPQDLLARLKKLAQEKTAGWPQVRDFEDFEKALDTFEKDLAALAAAATHQVETKAAPAH